MSLCQIAKFPHLKVLGFKLKLQQPSVTWELQEDEYRQVELEILEHTYTNLLRNASAHESIMK